MGVCEVVYLWFRKVGLPPSLHMSAVLRFYRKVSTSGNKIHYILFKLLANQIYCQQLFDNCRWICAILDLHGLDAKSYTHFSVISFSS